ncbi:hypothetical protein FS837_009282 [Tulasnella sp. UAMH 9824]|nr:hypothetical protein FS837_009282 [Tulasnella sp. UAMH 9824]
MPPHRNVHQSVFGSFGPGPFSYGAVPTAEGISGQAFNDPLAYAQQTTEPSSYQGPTVDIFEEMARSMREAFASFESVDTSASSTATQAPSTSAAAGTSATTNSQTTPPNPTDANTGSGFTFQFPSTAAEHGLPRDGPFPPLFTDHQPRTYGFNWSESTADGAAHPGSMPYSSSRDPGADQHHHHHHHHHHGCRGGPGGSRGRYTPYGRGRPPPHFHHFTHRPPPPFGAGPFPFGFGGPFGHDGPFGFRGPWNRPPPPPFAASNMEEEFSKAREQQQEAWQKLYERLDEMRSRMHRGAHWRADGFGAHHHPSRGRGGYQSGRGRYESYASASGDGHPRSGGRSRSAPAPKDVPKPRNVDVAKAWETYSAQWMKLLTTDAPATIKLAEVPWPVMVDTSKMKTLSDMTSAVTATTVGEFILSPKHSPDVPNKKRIHQALRLYHPDRFEITVVAKLEEKDKQAVRELGEVVAKCLNKLLEKEN